MTNAELLHVAARRQDAGELRGAAQLCRQVIDSDPTHAAAHHLLGILAHQSGHGDAAVALLRQAVELAAPNEEYNFDLGIVLMMLKRHDQAIAAYQSVLALNPDHVLARHNLAHVLATSGRLEEAIGCYREAVRRAPLSAAAYFNLANALREQRQLTEAAECYRRAMELDPQHAEAASNLGNLLKDQGELALAESCHRQAVAASAGHAEVYNNLGAVLMDQGRRAEAAACFAEALRLQPEHVSAHWNRALLRLLEGDLPKAWWEFEYRWKRPGAWSRHDHSPRWDGAPLDGKTILLHAEQGYGDTIQFIRYAPLVKALGGTVVCECQPALVQLLSGVTGLDAVYPAGAPLPRFHVQAPLMSLPAYFETTLATIPSAVPYLKAEPARSERWRNELASLDALKIGIVWQGRPTHKNDRFRSIPLRHFAGLAEAPGVRLVSLQKGYGSEQLDLFPEKRTNGTILDFGNRLDDGFLDAAALLIDLDLIISVDTSIAHLAGALGVPVWVAVSAAPDWRWLLERADSPWYPTLRLFRQTRLGDWNDVFTRIKDALAHFHEQRLRRGHSALSKRQPSASGYALPPSTPGGAAAPGGASPAWRLGDPGRPNPDRGYFASPSGPT